MIHGSGVPHRTRRWTTTTPVLPWLFVGIAMIALPVRARIASSFLETFGSGTFDHAPWSPLNAASLVSLPPTSADRNRMDGLNDGVLLIKRGVGVTGDIGATRSLGTVEGPDVGASITVDFSYERPADSFGGLSPRLLVAGKVVAEGATISLFSGGEDPGAASGSYSAVRSTLTYRIVADDLGKEMSLAVQFFDGNISENRDLAVDAVSLIHTGDPIPAPRLTPAIADLRGTPAFALTFTRRIAPYLPALAYSAEASEDLWSWTTLDITPEDTVTTPVDTSFEQVTALIPIGLNKRKFHRLTVRNRRIGDPGVPFDAGKMDSRFPQMLVWKTAGVQGGVPIAPVVRG